VTTPEAPQPVQPRQRFPSGKQALVIFFGSIGLSLTTCATVIVVFGEKQVSDFGAFLIGVTVVVCVFAPVAGFWVLVVYLVRRFTNKSTKGAP